MTKPKSPKPATPKPPPITARTYPDMTDVVITFGTPRPGIVLGSTVEDTTTGLIGMAVCRTTHLHGTPRIGVQPRAEGSKIPEMVYLEEGAVRVLALRA